MNSCLYYQAHVNPPQCWYFTSLLRSYEHMAFDRTVDVENSIFEFFVPELMEEQFLKLMHYFEQEKIISGLQKMENRLVSQPR